jgi:hypothetical protein
MQKKFYLTRLRRLYIKKYKNVNNNILYFIFESCLRRGRGHPVYREKGKLMKKLLPLLTFLSLVCLGAEWDYTGTAYYVGNEDGTPTGIFRDGDYWYMVGNGNDSVYRYDDNWSYTGTAYYIGNEDGGATDIHKDGDYWYMVGNDNDSIFQYDNNWSYTGTAYYVGGEDATPTGICKDGSYWYLVGISNDSVYRYDDNWSYTGTAYYVGGEDGTAPQIRKDGTYWYMSGYDNDSVYRYDNNWSYTGTAYYIGNEDGWPSGIYRYGDYWYMSGNDNDSIHRYEGLPTTPVSPTLIRIFDNAMFNAYPPPYVCTLSFSSTDPQSDDVQYEIQWDMDHGFSSASSDTTGTYPSGNTAVEAISLGTAAEAETLFYWKARARDPGGSNVWSDWSVIRSFTMDMDLGDDFPYWYQVAGDQFNQGTMDNVIVQGNSVVLLSTEQIEFQRASGSTGTSHNIDIGSPGNNRLVVVIACDESSDISLTNVTVDGNNCIKAGEADNPSGSGNHQELWYILESALGSSSGTVNVACTGGDAGWAAHVHVYYGVDQSAPYDFEIEEAVASGNTISVENVSSSDGSVVIFGAAQGMGGRTAASWTSPLSVRTDGPDPSEADLATASGVESSGQTDKTYVCTWSAFLNRGTGIVAVWEPAPATEGTITSHPVAYGDLLVENSSRSDWDGAKWTKSSAYDSIGMQIQYLSGGSWSPVPDVDLPGNSNYFFQMDTLFCNVDLSGLNTTTYDTLRLKLIFRAYASAPSPSLIMWALGQTGGVTSVPLSDDKFKFALYLPNANILVSGMYTEIKYQLPREEKVKLGVFDLLGREVATLVDTKKSRGIHRVSWKGTNNYNKPLACGVYFLKMEAGEFKNIKKLVFIR